MGQVEMEMATKDKILKALQLFEEVGFVSCNTQPTFVELVRNVSAYRRFFGFKIRQARPKVGDLLFDEAEGRWRLFVYGRRNLTPMTEAAQKLSDEFKSNVKVIFEESEREECLDALGGGM